MLKLVEIDQRRLIAKWNDNGVGGITLCKAWAANDTSEKDVLPALSSDERDEIVRQIHKFREEF